jgi:CO/xanthine dehydrogenase Mo-binding subunit
MDQGMLAAALTRQDAMDKAAGTMRYVRDDAPATCLHAALHTSTVAHGLLQSVDVSEAWSVPGVLAILTGEDCPYLTGPQIRDMPILARGTVRYFGEPVALVVAREAWQARQVANLIRGIYAPLPVVSNVAEALKPDATLIHPELKDYTLPSGEVYPRPGSNIVQHAKTRKGDMREGWARAEVTVEGHFSLPQAAHGYMETRCAVAEIRGDGTVFIQSATQAPHMVRNAIADLFQLPQGQVEVDGYPAGGAYGGKVNAHPELLAFLAARAVGGKRVCLPFPREQCFFSVGCKMGAECDLRLGATREGKITALAAQYHLDTGAYADTGPRMTRAIAASTGEPYDIGCLQTDALCVYTNHVYATSFRGFGHEVSTFCMERMMDKLAAALPMDPVELRRRNLNRAGLRSSTGVSLTLSNYGDPEKCLLEAARLIRWEDGPLAAIGPNKVRAKGLSCFTKTSSSPTDASSGAVVIFCQDGSVNVHCGAVECGQGILAALRQIVAEKLCMDPSHVYVKDRIDTRTAPQHWKTVASMAVFLAGNAVLAALEDAIAQLKRAAAVALRCQGSHLAVANEKVFQISDPSVAIEIRHLTGGLQFEDGKAIFGQIIGRGSYTMEHLSKLDKETGQGRPGPFWTPGAQAVEIEYDTKECTFRLLRAVTAVDAGRVINPGICRGQITGAMHMGLSVASREHFVYDKEGRLMSSSFRTYKVMHPWENPQYEVAFVETPNMDGPYGHRGLGEHGVLGMGAALSNALSRAMGKEVDALPLTFEALWRAAGKPGGAL